MPQKGVCTIDAKGMLVKELAKNMLAMQRPQAGQYRVCMSQTEPAHHRVLKCLTSGHESKVRGSGLPNLLESLIIYLLRLSSDPPYLAIPALLPCACCQLGATAKAARAPSGGGGGAIYKAGLQSEAKTLM